MGIVVNMAEEKLVGILPSGIETTWVLSKGKCGQVVFSFVANLGKDRCLGNYIFFGVEFAKGIGRIPGKLIARGL